MKQDRSCIDDCLVSYLRECGISTRKISRLTLDSRLYHDLGIYGDEAEGCMEALQTEFGVDMSGFDFSDYFPPEFPGRNGLTATLITFLPLSVRRLYVHADSNYKPVTLTMLRDALIAKRWLVK